MKLLLPRLVGITADAAGSGKDTAADHIVERFGFHKYSLATPIKLALNAMFGWTMAMWEDRTWKEAVVSELGFSPRQLAQTLGTEWGRSHADDFWLRRAAMEWNFINYGNIDHFGPLPMMVIPDIRFDNEAQWVRDRGGVVIRVRRPDATPVNDHVSEQGVNATLVDGIVKNDVDINEFRSRFVHTLGALAGFYHGTDDTVRSIHYQYVSPNPVNPMGDVLLQNAEPGRKTLDEVPPEAWDKVSRR